MLVQRFWFVWYSKATTSLHTTTFDYIHGIVIAPSRGTFVSPANCSLTVDFVNLAQACSSCWWRPSWRCRTCGRCDYLGRHHWCGGLY